MYLSYWLCLLSLLLGKINNFCTSIMKVLYQLFFLKPLASVNLKMCLIYTSNHQYTKEAVYFIPDNWSKVAYDEAHYCRRANWSDRTVITFATGMYALCRSHFNAIPSIILAAPLTPALMQFGLYGESGVDSKSYLLYLANKGAIQRRRRVDDITAARNANAVGLSSYPRPLDLLPVSGFNLFVCVPGNSFVLLIFRTTTAPLLLPR